MTGTPARPGLVLAGVALGAGILAGVSGALLSLLLQTVEHLLLGYSTGTFGQAFSSAPDWRRIAAPTAGGAVAGLGWWLLRRSAPVPGLQAMEHDAFGLRALWRVVADAVLQVVIVGSGASVGRKGAPRQTAAALTAFVSNRINPEAPARRMLVAAAAGAGLAAVYTTPAAGALFAVEIVLADWGRRSGLTALTVSVVAVLAAWPVTHDAATYAWPGGSRSWLLLAVIPVAAALPCALAGIGFAWLTSRARARAAPPSHLLPLWLGGAGALLGVAACWLPMLPGNGKAIVQYVLVGGVPLVSAAALIVAKPLITAVFFRAGATGGLLTPALATGAALGTALNGVLHLAGLPSSPAEWALAGAAGILAVTQRAPWFAALFAWELAGPPLELLPTLVVTSLLSCVLAATMRRRRARATRRSPAP